MQRAPGVTLTAYGHGRKVAFGTPGVPMVLVCVARETSDQGSPVTRAIRDAYPEASEVVVCNIADVRGIPKLLKPVVQQLMKSGYNHAVENLRPGHTAEEHVLIVPDWDNELLGPLGIDDVTKTIAVVVLAADGRVVLRHQGDDPAGAALAALDPIIGKVPA
jgi:hypothetical protein